MLNPEESTIEKPDTSDSDRDFEFDKMINCKPSEDCIDCGYTNNSECEQGVEWLEKYNKIQTY